MPELRTCYFCGEVGDGLARRAVVPPELDPDADDQVTVTLCPTCSRKFSTALEPLIERATALSAAGAGGGAASHTGSAPDAEPDPAAETASDAETTPEAETTLDAELASDAETTPDVAAEADAGTAPDAETTGGSDDGAVIGGDAATEPSPIEFGPADGGDAGEEVADGSLDDPLAVEPDDPDAGRSTGENDAEDGETRGDETRGDEGSESGDGPIVESPESIQVDPTTFRKVMRLLSNREFPVDRAEFVSLAASAYDLDDRTVGAMLDAAVEKDLIGEHDGQLVRD